MSTSSRQAADLAAEATVNVHFVQPMSFPVEVLLPLRLIIYNRNVRRTLITGTETTLPRPLAEWLAKDSPLKGRVVISGQKAENTDT